MGEKTPDKKIWGNNPTFFKRLDTGQVGQNHQLFGKEIPQTCQTVEGGNKTQTHRSNR